LICHVHADFHRRSSPTVFQGDRSMAGSNEFAVTAVLREVKGGRAKFGQFYFAWGCFRVFHCCS
jgi:hypothetical protein